MTKGKQWYKYKIVTVLAHLAVWAIICLVPYLIRPEIAGLRNAAIFKIFVWDNIIQYAILAAIFYFNAFWLIPELLNKKKYVAYVAVLIGILAIGLYNHMSRRRMFGPEWREQAMLHERSDRPFPLYSAAGRPGPPLLPGLFPVVFIIALSNTYRFFLDKLRAEKLQQERETEHLKSELSFLRSQISPHFIFNVLNSAVSLTRTQPAQVEPTLLKLSGLMRYMLYDTDDVKVPLNQEIEYLEAYVELQRLRFGDLANINFTKSGVFFGYAIEPMLLIPFVENAFKHGMSKVNEPSICIAMREEHARLFYQVKNRYSRDQSTRKDKYSGIGLSNVKKRLDILYGTNYDLSVTTSGSWHEVNLKIPLQ